MSLIVYGLFTIGLAYIVGYSSLSLPVRVWLVKQGRVGSWLVRMIECAVCCGTWVGLVLGFTPFAPALVLSGSFRWWTPIANAIVTAGLNAVLARIVGLSIPNVDEDQGNG